MGLGGAIVGGVAGGAVGAAVGAAVGGTVFGFATGGIGAVPGTIGGAAGGALAGGTAGALAGSVLEDHSQGGSASVTYAPPIDHSAVMMVASDNQKTTALAQIMAQQFALQQASMDRQMQAAANLELGLERFDTKLQIAKLDYVQFMQAEENRHTEALASKSKKLTVLEAGASSEPAGTLEMLDQIENELA